ncbi:MAG: hypothetical protein HGB19_07820 [Chlorobiales bacterium]|nr:hypothetical protein [Chlorobiales bacterium]
MLASASWKIVISDALTGDDVKTLATSSATEYFYSVAFSPDGKWIASGDSGQMVRLWSIASGREVFLFKGHKQLVNNIAFSPDSTVLASASNDGTIRLWDPVEQATLKALKAHMLSVNGIAFSPGGRFLISGSSDKTAILWDVHSGKVLQTFVGHAHQVSGVAINSKGTLLATGSWDKTIKLWNIKTGDEIATLNGHPNGVIYIGFVPQTDYLISISYDRFKKLSTMKLSDCQSGHELGSLKGSFYTIAISSDGKTIGMANTDRSVSICNMQESLPKAFDQLIKEVGVQDHDDKDDEDQLDDPDGIRHHKDRRRIAVSRRRSRRLPLETVFEVKSILNDHSSSKINALTFSPDETVLATVSWKAVLTNVTNGENKYSLSGFSRSGYLYAVAFSADGNMFATSGSDKVIRLWETKTGNELGSLFGHKQSVNHVAFSPGGTLLASASNDGFVRLWAINRLKEVERFKGHEDSVNTLVFSPNGSFLASAGSDKVVMIWNVAAGKAHMPLVGHTHPITAVAYGNQGNMIATGSSDGDIKIWDSKTGAMLRAFSTNVGSADFLAFSPDTELLISSSYNRNRKLSIVKLWDVRTEKEIAAMSGEFYCMVMGLNGNHVAFANTDWSIWLCKAHLFSVDSFEKLDLLMKMQKSNGERRKVTDRRLSL